MGTKLASVHMSFCKLRTYSTNIYAGFMHNEGTRTDLSSLGFIL